MATVNVNRNLTDQFYRYKMPKLMAKVEGKGNGIKTVIVNMVDIAKALNRPPMYPTKYFGCLLGAQVNCDVKNERYIVNGSHDSNKLQDLLDGFIKKYVLCQNCENPETILSVNQKKGTISASCKACGHLAAIGVKDKLSTYILKFPPDTPVTGQGASVTKKSKKDAKNAKNGRGSPQNDSDEMNDTVEGKNGSAENGDEDDDGDWCDNQQIEQLTCGAQKLTINADLEKKPSERLGILFDFIKNKLDAKCELSPSVQKEIVAEAERLDVKEKAVIVLCEVLFTESVNIVKVIETNRALFLRFTHESLKAQKYLLRGLELTVKLFPTELLPRVAKILKCLYDLDILDEKAILDWDSKRKPDKGILDEMHEKAQVFITWLREAESESEDDDDVDDDGEEEEALEVVYDERSRPDKIVEIKEEPKLVSKPKAADDDLDIDAI